MGLKLNIPCAIVADIVFGREGEAYCALPPTCCCCCDIRMTAVRNSELESQFIHWLFIHDSDDKSNSNNGVIIVIRTSIAMSTDSMCR